jgi:single-stranded-DNA-specific exonuclease
MIKIRARQAVSDIQWPDTVHPLLQRIYSARHVEQAADVELSIKKLLPPGGLSGLQAAVKLLADALTAQQHIMIIGDFDADGATSTALAMRVLRRMGAGRLSFLVPNRFEYGYGLTTGIVREALKKKPDLIVTVDNGISNIEGVKFARANGVRVLLTDHHLPGKQLPEADAIVNPNQADDPFPSKSLAGVGVIFYVLSALRKQLRESGWFEQKKIIEPNMADYLDIVALGTVADVVPLDRNNRILVNEGIKRIRAGRCVKGITALLEAAQRNPARLVSADLGFAVGPRLNAAGRLDDMSVGIECLLADDDSAYRLASQLDGLNRERRSIETGMQSEAIRYLEKIVVEDQPVFGLSLYDETWHQGVIGILASRIKEKIHRPVIVFAPGDVGEIKGSGRSISGIHIRDVLEAVSSRHPGMIKKFGGHAMAAGLTIPESAFKAFADAFNRQIEFVSDEEMLEAVVLTDGQLEIDYFDIQTVEVLEQGGPWGQAFPEPLFNGSFRVINQRVLKGRHVKLVLAPEGDSPGDRLLDGIVFNHFDGTETEHEKQLPETVELVYKLAINDFRGQQSLQLIIDHVLY